MTQFVSQVSPPSAENACSHRQEWMVQSPMRKSKSPAPEEAGGRNASGRSSERGVACRRRTSGGPASCRWSRASIARQAAEPASASRERS
jgi:hypothetical protein